MVYYVLACWHYTCGLAVPQWRPCVAVCSCVHARIEVGIKYPSVHKGYNIGDEDGIPIFVFVTVRAILIKNGTVQSRKFHAR